MKIPFISRFFKKKQIPNYILDDDDRQEATEARRIQREKRRLIQQLKDEQSMIYEQLKVEKLRADLRNLKEDLKGDDSEEDEEDDPLMVMAMTILSQMNMAKGQTSVSPFASSPVLSPLPVNPQTTFSDDDIRAILGRVPEIYKRQGSKLSDDVLKSYIAGYYPTADPDTMDRAIRLFRQGNN